jgi:hypothetical protein
MDTKQAFLDFIEGGKLSQKVADEVIRAHARRSDPETSHAAAASVKNLTELQALILSALKDRPCIDDVLIARINNSGLLASASGIRSRRSELVALGMVRDSGQRETLPSGRKSIVWEIAKAEPWTYSHCGAKPSAEKGSK